MEKQNILFLIDYSSLLSTSFFGNLPPAYKFAKTDEEKDNALPKLLQTSFGAYTNGVITMMTKLEGIIKKINPKYVAGGWDLTRDTFRREIYPEYKGNRSTTRPELSSQFAIAQEIMKEMNMPCFAFERFEADDVLGTLSKKFADDIKVIILTKDQDSLQLIGHNVSVWLMTSKAEEKYKELGINPSDYQIIDGVYDYNPQTFEEDYGFTPIQMIDYKSLCGDSSDNIPGVKGVGDKAVIPLLKEFGDLEGIYDYIENTPEKEAKAFMKELGISRSPISYLLKEPTEEEKSKGILVGKESAFVSKKLATIECNIPELQDVTLADLELKIDIEGRKRAYTKYEFKSLLKNS